jgi:molecular chaperone Hsp33
MTAARPTDSALRAITDDGAFRVITVRTTDTVRRMLAAQSLWGAEAQQLAEVATGAILVRETMAPQHRLQVLLRSADGARRWVGESSPDGGARGLLTRKESAGAAASPAMGAASPVAGGVLEVVRTLHNGELHRGVVQVPPSGSTSQGLMIYLQESEQVASMLAVACVLGEDHVVAAGGYLVQLLPEVGRGPLAIMAERLRDFEDIGPLLAKTDAAPSPLLDELLFGMPFTRIEESAVSWKCRCSAERVLATLGTLPREEQLEMIAEGKPLEISCDFCRTAYVVTPEQLEAQLGD